MTYATLADLRMTMSERTLIALSNDDGAANKINQPVIEAALAAAKEVADGYLRGRYVLPLSSTPTIIRDISIALARHWLYARRADGKDLPDAVTRTYKAALEMLREIQNGKMTLGILSGKDAPEPGRVRVRAKAATFPKKLMDKYH